MLIRAARGVEMSRRKLDAGCVRLKLEGEKTFLESSLLIRKDPNADNSL